MEVYKSSVPVTIDVDVPLNPGVGDVVVAKRGNTIIHTFVAEDFSRSAPDAPLTVTLPLRLVLVNQSFRIEWSLILAEEEFNYVTDVDVVSPIVPIAEVQTIVNGTRDEAIRAEKRVRYLIESITNSKFYPYSAAYAISNPGSNVLVLPDRLLQLRSISFNSYYYPLEQLIIGDRHITIDPNKWLTIKSDFEGVPGDYPQSIVWNPYRHNSFSSKIIYLVDGMWGYGTTPVAVEQAARMLLKDFGCSEDVWRQRGLASIAMGDTRIEFGSNAGTGNVDADKLLAPFVQNAMFVI